MIPKNSSLKKYWYGSYEDYESRILHRLQNDLGVDESAAETILRLRNQVVELQSHLRQMEAELYDHVSSQQVRLARYRDVFYETTWIELEVDE